MTMGSPASKRRRRGSGEVSIEVGFPGGEGRLDAFGALFLGVVHLGEPFAAQQLFGHIRGGLTDARHLDQRDPRRLGRWLRGHPTGGQTKQPGGPRECQSS